MRRGPLVKGCSCLGEKVVLRLCPGHMRVHVLPEDGDTRPRSALFRFA